MPILSAILRIAVNSLVPDFGDKYLSTNLWQGWSQRAPRFAHGLEAEAANPYLRLA